MLKWDTDNEFTLDQIDFVIDPSNSISLENAPINKFVINKNKKRIEKYLKIARSRNEIQGLLELGSYRGGSLVFFDKLFKPNLIAGLDISKTSYDNLNNYILNVGSKMKVFPGIAQTDFKKMSPIIHKFFSEKIDVVIDDASHWYEPSKLSFKYLFPKLMPGGLYIIETWNWSFKPAHQSETHTWFKKPSLSNLIFDVIQELATNPSIENISVYDDLFIITKSKTSTNGGKLFSKNSQRNRSLGHI